MRCSTTLQVPATKQLERVDDCADYLLKYQNYLRYDVSLQRGLPIEIGFIERTCRHFVNDCLDISGAHWGLPGAEAVLKLRTLRSSRDLDEGWKLHKAHALERDHTARYGDVHLPEAA